MKVKPEHMQTLRVALAPLDTVALRAEYAAGKFPHAERCKDVDMRYRWDLLYMVHGSVREPLMKALYAYANDSHIDTALRAIVDLHPLTDTGK